MGGCGRRPVPVRALSAWHDRSVDVNAPELTARRIRDAQPGDVVEFGRYPHQVEGTDRTPISWQVLERAGDELFLVSARILDCRRYYDEATETTWRDSAMRQWLNGAFLSQAFSEAEQGIITPNRCDDNGNGTPDTVDRVFLLSVQEVRALTHPGQGHGLDRRAVATPFAIQKKSDGCHLYVYDKTVEKDHVVVDGDRRGCSWWWTRTQPQAQNGTASRAAFIGARGDVKSYGRVDIPHYGVRPAIKLDASSRHAPTES